MGQNYRKYAQASNRLRKTSRNDKKNMLSENGYRCERCGMSVRRVGTHIVHKNGIKSDNRKSNVTIVCRDCFNDMNSDKKVKDPKTKITTFKVKKEKPEKKKSWWQFW